jgi:hypothetical protein
MKLDEFEWKSILEENSQKNLGKTENCCSESSEKADLQKAILVLFNLKGVYC